MSIKYCPTCGTALLADTSRFCHACGAALPDVSTPAAVLASEDRATASSGTSSSTSSPGYTYTPSYSPTSSTPVSSIPPYIPAPVPQATRTKLNGATFSVIVWTLLWLVVYFFVPLYRYSFTDSFAFIALSVVIPFWYTLLRLPTRQKIGRVWSEAFGGGMLLLLIPSAVLYFLQTYDFRFYWLIYSVYALILLVISTLIGVRTAAGFTRQMGQSRAFAWGDLWQVFGTGTALLVLAYALQTYIFNRFLSEGYYYFYYSYRYLYVIAGIALVLAIVVLLVARRMALQRLRRP